MAAMNYYTIRLAIEQFGVGNIAYYETIVDALCDEDKKLVENYLDLRYSIPDSNRSRIHSKAPYSSKSEDSATPIRHEAPFSLNEL